MNLSINQSIHQSMDIKDHSSTLLFIDPYSSIHLSTYLSIYPCTYLNIYQSIYLFIYFYYILIEADIAMKLDGKELLGRNLRLDWTD